MPVTSESEQALYQIFHRRVGCEMIDSQRGAHNHLISSKHQWNSRFIENASKNYAYAYHICRACYNYQLLNEAEKPSASVDNTLLDLQNSSYPTKAIQ